MSLKDDMEMLEIYQRMGLGKEYIEGTTTIEQRDEAARQRHGARWTMAPDKPDSTG